MSETVAVENEAADEAEAEPSAPDGGDEGSTEPTAEPQPDEGDPGDEDGEAEAELAEAPREPEQARTDTDIDKALVKIGKRAQTFTAFVADQLGDDAIALVQCELCHPQIPGWHFTDEFMRDNKMHLPDLQARLFEVLRTPQEVQYRALVGYRTCPDCDGEGKGETGSKVPTKRLGTCPTCKGNGYLAPQGQPVFTESATATNGVVQLNPESVPPHEETDPWGSPRLLPDGRENPNYGKIIHFKDPAFP